MSAHHELPTRTMTQGTEDDAIPDDDASEVTRLFHERLQAWKHAVVYLENYVEATEKMQHAHGKEYEKVLKTVNSPLKEGHHFDQSLGGVAGMFDNIRTNTQGISTSHYETAKTLKGSVLPVFSRLHSEIKNKTKELTKGAGKGSKAVDKARNATQKHIELLGQHIAAYESTAATKVKATEDPYILQRGVMHRLHTQILEENNNRQDMIAVQNSFSTFEAHVLKTVQTGLGQFAQVLSAQADQQKAMYGDLAGTAQRVPPDFEWSSFVKRNGNLLIDPSGPPRSIDNVTFPNQNHKATQPLIAGYLETKGKILKKYDAGFFVVTPAKYLHEFKTDDDHSKDITPEKSLYLPDCTVGYLDGLKFDVKGKDVHSTISKLGMSHEYAFKARTPEEAQKWWETIRSAAGQTTNDLPEKSAPSSPVESRQTGAAYPPQYAEKETASVAHPTSATHPTSALPAEGSGYATQGSGYAPHGGAPSSGVERAPGQY
ncbi:hypothetical protein B0A49_02753 [Cryomyces minteri]|uniref:PH domain-containing protein n=1 Tax=Cryomyces minteri TaxID=331657 RepID=A0A4U0XBW3_9PEZI|nr:hypothetical protein B0A49_02753 [Cryomyces minteri]